MAVIIYTILLETLIDVRSRLIKSITALHNRINILNVDSSQLEDELVLHMEHL